MLDTLAAPRNRRVAGVDALARLDRGLRVGADHQVAGFEQLALPATRVEVKHRAGPLEEVGVAREDPRLVPPGSDRVLGQPAPDRRGRRLADGLLDDEAVQLRAAEARQRHAVGLGQLASNRFDLRDLFRGENDAGDPTALDPQDRRCPQPRTVFANQPPGQPTCPHAGRSHDWCACRRPATPAWRGPRPDRPTSGSPPVAQAHRASPHRARPLSLPVPRHNIRQLPSHSFTTTELPAGSN